jgi:hypothetical protein
VSTDPDWGGDPSAAAQAVALDQLKLVLSRLPNLEIPLNPPENRGPREIDLMALRQASARQRLADRYDMLVAAFAGFRAMGAPISPELCRAYIALVHDVIAFEAGLGPNIP